MKTKANKMIENTERNHIKLEKKNEKTKRKKERDENETDE